MTTRIPLSFTIQTKVIDSTTEKDLITEATVRSTVTMQAGGVVRTLWKDDAVYTNLQRSEDFDPESLAADTTIAQMARKWSMG